MGHPEPASGIQISAHFLYFQWKLKKKKKKKIVLENGMKMS
jgi:hypothetical protein